MVLARLKTLELGMTSPSASRDFALSDAYVKYASKSGSTGEWKPEHIEIAMKEGLF
ncbi:hypothetical protein [Paenibacillus guangzhouensis]|uniref:hypothetical protein n=1 Tax=Paenibacillus guangzhouensis TaxID=1473112 RepID=UPI00187BA4A7|nr:hypothetical protein [Paenibacillus guangzhouensis]